MEYDALLIAVGARQVEPYDHVATFWDADADATYQGVVQDVEEGYSEASRSSSRLARCGRCRYTSSLS